MDQIKIFYECIDCNEEDEVKSLQKACNKWLEKNAESIEVKNIATTMSSDNMETLITVHYKSMPLSL